MADRIGILADGVLVQIGSPKTIYMEPANLHVAARLGQPAINLIPVGLLPDAAVPSGTKTIGARTEHLTIEKSANGHADGVIDWVEHLGDQNHLHLTVKDRKLITLTDTDTPFRKGDCGDRSLPRAAVLRRRRQQDRGVADGIIRSRHRTRRGVRPPPHPRGECRRRESGACVPSPYGGIRRGGMSGIHASMTDHDILDTRPHRRLRRHDRGACRRADRARPGDRRRRPWAEHEARLRGGARRSRSVCRQAFARRAEGHRHQAGDDGRRRFRAAVRHLLHGARQGTAGRPRAAPI